MRRLMGMVKFTRVFAAAHRVWNDPGKCRNIHGHNYRVEAIVSADGLTSTNFVVPFDAVKRAIDWYDHALIIDAADPLADTLMTLGLTVRIIDGVPSTEFVAAQLAQAIADATLVENDGATHVVADVTLAETDSITAFASASATAYVPGAEHIP